MIRASEWNNFPIRSPVKWSPNFMGQVADQEKYHFMRTGINNISFSGTLGFVAMGMIFVPFPGGFYNCVKVCELRPPVMGDVVTLWSYVRYSLIILWLSYQLNKSSIGFNGTRGFSFPSRGNRSLPYHLFLTCVPRHPHCIPIHPPPNNIPLLLLDRAVASGSWKLNLWL